MGFDLSAITGSADLLAQGMLLSLLLVVAGSVGGCVLGTGLALMRNARLRAVALPAAAYVTVLRSVPLILVLFWFYFMAPLAIGHPVGALPSALVAFVLFEAAFYCEIIRAGIGAVPPGQAMAAAASGLRRWQALRLVILPQTLAAMTPLLVNQVIILFQDTSLVYVVSLRDFLTAASVVAGRDDRPVEMYCFVAVVYFVICLAGSRLAGRTRRPVFQ
jgi:glutamate/aspartate transport system permease protein